VRRDKSITVTLTLRHKAGLNSRLTANVLKRQHLTVTEAIRAFSHSEKDDEAVRRFADEYDLRIISADKPASIELRGTANQLKRAFGVNLFHYSCENHDGTFHGHDGQVTLPAYLKGVVTGVFGLDNLRAGRRPGLAHRMAALGIAPPPVTAKTRKPADFALLYNFPPFTGKGQSIGLLEFGGGFRTRELEKYFRSVGIVPPRIVVKEVAPGKNQTVGKPGTLNPDTEVYLDLEVVGSLAPEANIVVYFGEDNEQGWLHTLQEAIFDKTHDLSVISISWGQAEQEWSPNAIVEIDKLFQVAAHRGITVCCSSGDNGVSEFTDHPFTVAFPASSPHVLACGGTRLHVGSRGSRDETVWNQWRQYKLASGGGVSGVFSLPLYQKRANVPTSNSNKKKRGRGIPDVSANASSDTGYLIEADNTRMSMGGTSAAAPLWAALAARLNEALKTRIGFVTPLLYEMTRAEPKTVSDIVKGFNGPTRDGGYQARRGWDACTGLGSPNGSKILKYLNSKRR
jgi:kumamolisin